MNFGTAVEAIRKGKKVARHGWNGKNMYLVYLSPAEHFGDFPIVPFIAIKTVDDVYQPWNASQTDVFATDWYVVE